MIFNQSALIEGQVKRITRVFKDATAHELLVIREQIIRIIRPYAPAV